MAKKKCCSCCNCCPNLSFQMKFLLAFSIIFPFITIGIMILIMYNTYSFIYQEITKLYDIDEFQELDHIENYLENTELNIENVFKNNLQSIVNLYKEFSNFQDNNNNYFIENITNRDDFIIELLSNETVFEQPYIDYMFYLDNETIADDEKNWLSYLGIYLKNIFEENNFLNNNQSLLLICDYSDTNETIYFYPGYKDEINKDMNITLIKEYAIKKILQKINDFISLKQILIHGTDFYNNLFLLPYFDDDNYSVNNDLKNLTEIIFNSSYVEWTIKNIAFMFLPSKQENTSEYVELNFDNLENNTEKIFLLIGITANTENNIFNKIKSKNNINEVNLLTTNYLFPYELTETGSCQNILGNNGDFKYLDQCFNKEEKLETLDGYDKYEDFSTYDLIINDLNLFKNIMKSEDQYNSEVFEFYRLLEKKMLQEIDTSYHKSIYNITLINDKNFKILKAYSPLQIIYQTNYFYPIYNIKLHLILINEESINELLSNIKDLGGNRLLIGSLFLLLAAIIYIIVAIIMLVYIQKELRKPVKRMNILNNLYYGQIDDDDLRIDEFKEIIKSITFELKYDSDYLNSGEKQENENTKIETENFNKDFEKNKIYNIFVDKEKINKLLEESNYSNEIINNASLLKIQNDPFVKRSTLFKESAKMGDFEELKNYEENDRFLFDKVYFREKNSLQNPNALFYKAFKKEFDEDYKEEDNNDEYGSDKKTKNKKKEEKNDKKENNENNENNINNDK